MKAPAEIYTMHSFALLQNHKSEQLACDLAGRAPRYMPPHLRWRARDRLMEPVQFSQQAKRRIAGFGFVVASQVIWNFLNFSTKTCSHQEHDFT